MSEPASAAAPAPPLLLPGAPAVVTGGAGFVGSHLVEELLRRGHPVHVVDDLSSGSLDHLAAVHGHPRLTVTIGSVAEPAVARAACAGAPMVFHLAGAVGVQRLAAQPVAVMQQNLAAAQGLLGAAAAAGAAVLFASSSEVYGDGPVPFREAQSIAPGSSAGVRGGYACAKAMGEWLLAGHRAQHGLRGLVARLFNTVGPRQSGAHGMVLPRFVRQALRGEPLTVYGSGEQTRCFAHVAEVAAALADLALRPGADGAVVNVGSAAECSVRDLAALVRRAAGSRSAIVLRPYAEVFPPGFVDPPRRVPCLDRLRALLGWVPERPLPAILAELVELARGDAAAPAAAAAAR